VQLEGPARRIALATAATVVVFVLARGVAIWRFDAAVDDYRVAVASEDNGSLVRAAIIDAWTEEAEVAHFVASRGDSEHLQAFETATASLDRRLRELIAVEPEDERRPVEDVIDAHDRYVAAIRTRRPALAAGRLGDLTHEQLGAPILGGLDALVIREETEADDSASAADSSSRLALVGRDSHPRPSGYELLPPGFVGSNSALWSQMNCSGSTSVALKLVPELRPALSRRWRG